MTGYQIGPGNLLVNDGLWTYNFDSEVNLIKKSKSTNLETWQYGYDNLNLLIWAKDEPTDGGSPTLIATYIYDVFGNRIEKDVWTSSGGTVISRFGYDIAEPQALAGGVANAWVDLNSSNQLVTRYLEGDQVGQPLARISAAGVAGWYLADHLGSVRNLTDNSGTLIDTIAYDAYGKINSESNPSNGDRFKWADLQYDSNIGLNFAKARPEDPSTGRWLEQDPSGFSAGDWNLYRYLNNGPTNATDPMGLQGQAGLPVAFGSALAGANPRGVPQGEQNQLFKWKISIEPNLFLMQDRKVSYEFNITFVPPARNKRWWILTEHQSSGILQNGQTWKSTIYRGDFQGPRSFPRDRTFYANNGRWAFFTQDSSKTLGLGPLSTTRLTTSELVNGKPRPTSISLVGNLNVPLSQNQYLTLWVDAEQKGVLKFNYLYINTKYLRDAAQKNPLAAALYALVRGLAPVKGDFVYEALFFSPDPAHKSRHKVTPIK